MSNRYQLVGLKNEELLHGVSRLVAQGNELTADILAHLVEVESRLLHAELGFPNLFSYCVESLGLSEGAAGRRCTAARVCQRFPEAFDLVARGELHLSALCGLATHLNPDNAAALFAACRRKTRRQVDEILASRFPKPDAKESIRRVPHRPAPAPEAAPVPVPAPETVLGATVALPASASDPIPIPLRPPPPHLPRSQEVQPTAAHRYKVQFTADANLRELIERACALCPNHSPQGQLALVVTRGLQLYVSQQEKRRFALGRRPRKSRPPRATGAGPDKAEPQSAPPGGVKPTRTSEDPQSAPPGGATQNVATDAALPAPPDGIKRRSIKAAVRRIVHERDQGRCTWVSPDGRRCAERARLQFDHVQPWSTRGGEDAANLRLLCSTHNRLHARHCFGERHIQAKIAARRAAARTTSESRRC
jgi:hypothetical protein